MDRPAWRLHCAAGLVLLLTSASAAAPDEAPLPRPRPGALVEAAPASLAPAEPDTLVGETGEPAPLPRKRPAGAEAGMGAAARLAKDAGPVTSPASVVSDQDAEGSSPVVAPLQGAMGPASAVAAIDLLARVPRLRPVEEPTGVLAMIAPKSTEPAPEAPAAPRVPAVLSADDGACLKRLAELGVSFTRLPPIDPGGACPVAAPLKVAGLGSGVELASDATMNCHTAEAVALWVRDVLIPASKADLGAVPTAIVPGSTYACRPRNNQAGARLSEHATANAFDVMSIAFAGRPPVEIGPRGAHDPEGRFQARIRESSCAYFTTVLGPGSDSAHANHLHFDLAERSGGYRLCSLGETLTAGPPAENTKRE